LTPRISVVTAAYQRAAVLRLALGTLVRQTFTDWEAIVVGDACTDASGEVVASFGDPRLRWINLEKNFGEQSRPNNVGVSLSSAPYLAYLNQDDLWFPDHLQTLFETIERTGADLVFSRAAMLQPNGVIYLSGGASRGRYGWSTNAPASTWLLRRELFDAVGPWKAAKTIYNFPSQDFLFRAHRRGHRLVQTAGPTAVLISSGLRPGSYRNAAPREHLDVLDRMENDAGYREQLRREAVSPHSLGSRLVDPIVFALGVHPFSIISFLRDGPRGGYVDRLRATRGLTKLPR
jgi:glycosyltransferase involved in cell wall biosynthesis